MSLIREKAALKEWAIANQSGLAFDEGRLQAETYFEDAGNHYITEYDFHTIPELERLFMEVWADKAGKNEAAKIMAVSAFKNRPEEEMEVCAAPSEKIPEHIYAF